MQLANVTFQNNDNHGSRSEIILSYVNLARSKYNAELIHEIHFWNENQKRNTSEKEKIPAKVTDSNLLNIKQRLAFDTFAKSLNDNKQLLMIIKGQVGYSKSFLIISLSQILGDPCTVCSYSGLLPLKFKENLFLVS